MSELYLIPAFALLLILDVLLAAGGSALKNSRPARLRRLIEEGMPAARLAARVGEEATRLLISARLAHGILGLATIGLGLAIFSSYAQSVGMLDWPRVVLVLVVIWSLRALLILVAENLALRNTEIWAVRLVPVLAGAVWLLSPVARMLLRLGARLSGAAGMPTPPVVTEEEIMTLVDAGEEGGVIEEEEKAMIYSIFQLGDTLAREVMVPRIDILAFKEDISLIQATDTLLETGYSRAPVYSETIDNIIGLVYVKDLLAAWRRGEEDGTVAGLLREAYFVPEAKKVQDLLAEMQSRRIQLAVVVDEYGGTAGVVTFEDIVEEIVGEVRDEYDIGEEHPYVEIAEGVYEFRGGIDLDDMNAITGSELPKEDSETLGGFIYAYLGRVPSPGDVIDTGGLHMVVEQVVGRRIRKVRATRTRTTSREATSKNDGTDQ